MSPAQRGILFQIGSGERAGLYHTQTVSEVVGGLDVDAFRRGWELVAGRHAALRTRFDAAGGEEPRQTVLAAVEVPLTTEDWSALDEEQRAGRLAALLEEDRARGFDPGGAPPWRLHLARLGDGRHQLLWSLHYLLMDGLSQARVLREVERAHAHLTSGTRTPLDLPPVTPFSDYVDWLEHRGGQEGAEGRDAGSDEDFWREELRAVSPGTPLPVERTAPAADPAGAPGPVAYGQAALVLDERETAALDEARRRHGLRLATVVQGAWALLLARYKNADEVVMGVTTPGRSAALPGVESMVGLLVNTLPLRVGLTPDAGAAEWLRGLQDRYARLVAHEYSPLVRIQQWSGIASGSSLFDTVVLVEDEEEAGPGDPGPAGGLRTRRVWRESHAGYPLSVVATPGERCTLTLHYDTRRFDAPAVERMAGHLRTVLLGLAERPDARLGELTLLTPPEFSLLVREWNDTDTPYSHDLCIHELFERRAADAPDALALLFEDERWTYRALNERANQVAHYLIRLGLGRGDQVAVVMERSAELVPALLGILKSGATYIPLDVGAPVRRWHWIIDSLGVTCVLTQRSLLPRLASADPLPALAHVVCLDPAGADAPPGPSADAAAEAPAGGGVPHTVHPTALLAAMPVADPPRRTTPQDLAYIIFTSGSTGTPKGVEVAHFPAVNLIEWVNHTFSVGEDDRILFVTAPTFDLSVYDVFGILAAGGSIRMATAEDIREPANLLRHLAREPITFWDSAPAALMQLVPLLPTDDEGEYLTVSDSLRLIFMSGDWIPVHSPGVLAQVFPNVQVVGLGGATEATVWSNYFPIGEVDPAWSSIPYGKPIQNARYYVLDESMHPCPLDVPGDLYIGGPCLSAGYAGEPRLTASKYLPSPFAAAPGERLYKTGDMARWRPDGNLEFLGRTDSQVKIRGYRIELGEIDSTLGEHPVVQDAATIVHEDRGGDRSLVSYVVLHPRRARSAVQDDADTLAGRRVERWREVYDSFDPDAARDSADGNDFSGWTSSYTGLPIPVAEMRAWQRDTVDLVRGHAPRAVLEIGCGTGLLLFPLAPGCARYHGTDFSSAALAAVRGRLGAHPGLAESVSLHQAEADTLGELALEPVDTVVVNSVVQYFPDVDYLLRVLDAALSHVTDGGRIIVGDVRSLPLLDAFHADVETERAPGATTRAQLGQRVQQRVREEEELTVAPAFFRDWACATGRVTRVEIRPKGGRQHNEMSMFRYQVVLHVGTPARTAPRAPGGTVLDWAADGLTPAGLERLLADTRPGRLRLHNIPNARVEHAVRTLAWLRGGPGPETAEAWRDQDRTTHGIDPDDLCDLAARAGYLAVPDWAAHGADGAFRALLVPADAHRGTGGGDLADEHELITPAPPGAAAPDWTAHVNQPLKPEIQHLLLPRLTEYLAERLPGYMVPSALVALDVLPVTASGKLDRRALVLPDAATAGASAARVPARTTTEALLVSVWEQILSRSPVGVLDNFFDLGGHSLLAVQLAARIRQVFSLEVPVRLFFDLPTIAEVARELQRLQDELQPVGAPPLTPVPRGGPLPATFDQRRLWFIDRMRPGTTSYTVNWLIPLPAAMDTALVRAALDEMVRRHEPLRTTFHEEDGQVWQTIADTWRLDLPVTDLSALPADAREQRAREEIRRWWDRPYDLVEGPLLRAMTVLLSGTQQLLVLGAHHMVFDGYSIGLFGEEFVQICRALAAGEPCPLPEPAVQYADYAVSQQSWVAEDRLAFHLDYWKEQLTGAPELLALPTDFPRPDEQSLRGDFLRRRLTADTTRRVAEVSREHQVTHYITMLSAYAVLLSRHSGQDVVVIGMPIANRNRVELESMIGFLVNTVAIKVDLRDNPTFAEVLLQVRKQTFDAQSHQEVPFERLVDALRPARSLGHNPVFQAMFADESLPLLDHAEAVASPEPWMHDLIAEGMSVGVSRFDITLMIQAAPEGMHIGFEYSTDLFEERTVARMAGRFETLLCSALADPGRPVGQLALLDEAEHREAVGTGVGPRNEHALPRASLTELFERRVRSTPAAVATVRGDEEVSYAALDRAANRLARVLRERGVRRGSPVGLCVPRSVEMAVGVLAVLKAGGAYVPLDPGYPGERLAYMVADAGVGLVLAARSSAGMLPESDATVLVVEDVWAELERWDDTPLPALCTGDDLAYVIYTSGSTGRPKGVAVTHADVAALALDSRFERGHERVLLHSPQAFDAATYELWAPLLTGGRSVIAPTGPVTPAVLRECVSAHGVTAVWLTAALFHLFAAEDPGCFTGLREVWTGGDAVRADAVHRVRAACRELVVVDGYGPTETTTFATCHRIEPGDAVPDTVPIGRPLDNMRTYVLDGLLQPVPVGVAGELFIGGVGLARGYVGRPDLTAEAFVASPFGGVGERLYRTGDLARFLPDGNVEFLGRVDDQVKVRGFRIELGEVEGVLAGHPGVRGAAVLVDGSGASKRLVAFVVPVEGVDLDVEGLRGFVGGRLPEYMVPGVIVPLGELPLSPNGKVDRRVLAGLSWEGLVGGGGEFVAPRSEVEVVLAGIWESVLGVGRAVGVHDDFFALGGDSILSLQVVFRAKQAGLFFSVRDLFRCQTVAELAGVVERGDVSGVRAEQGLVMGPVELTPVQRWFFAQDFAVPQHFNQSVLVEVEDGIAGADWERVVRRVLEQHDGLRARFVQGADGAWSSELLGVPEVLPWEVCDLSEHTEDRRQGYVSEVAGRVQAGLSLANGLVFRGVLFTGWGDGRDRLLLVAHHLVVDVVSWRVLLEDVETLTGQVRRGEELALPAKSSSWREWARQLAAEASSEKTAAEVPYWREQAETAGTLPVDESADAEGSRVVEAVLGAEETRRLLRDVPAVFNTRVNDVLLTGVARAVGVWCGSAFVRVDVEGHGREDLFGDVDVARTTGWFTTISPLRLPVADADGLGEGLKRVKEVLRERPRQGIGYGLLAHGPVETSLSGAAPAQVSFNYLGQFDDSFAGGFAASSGLAGPDWAAENRRPYPLDIVCHVRDGELHMEWTYDGAVHAEETVRGVAMDTLDALRGIGAQAVRPGAVGYSPSDFPLAELTQERVDALVDSLRTHPVWQAGGLRRPLEDCYPQTPVQQGLWFQSQYAQGEGVYHVQLVLGIDQELDVDAFRRSWSEVMRHHPILRTSFWTTEGSEALQLVWSAPPVPLDVVDWRAEDAEARQGLLDTYLAQDRARGFEPHDAPQWRMLLARTAEDSYQLVWSAHHSILDGWSISLILGEAAAQYGALVQGRPLDRAPGRPYRDYVSWLQRQDLAQAEEYWRDTLQGVDAASPLSIERHPGAGATPVRPGGQAEFVFSFDDELTARLQRMAHANRLTLNTVMQGCWALLLGRYTGGNDVVFGTVVSGRPPEVEGVERMVGLFINTLPVRVGIPDDGTALDWLTDLQERNLRMRQYEHTPLGDIQRWAGLPAGTPLFESLFVFENYPVEKDDKAALRFDLTRSEERIDSPLGVVVTVPDRLHLQVQYDSARFEREAIERLAGHLRSVCGQIAGDPGARLSGISVLTEEERRQVLKHGMSAPRQTAAEADLDLSALAAGLGTAEERELLEQLVAEIQEMSPSDLEAHILKASPATETSENHE